MQEAQDNIRAIEGAPDLDSSMFQDLCPPPARRTSEIHVLYVRPATSPAALAKKLCRWHSPNCFFHIDAEKPDELMVVRSH
ncbi:MAG: hypothetical protein WC350_06070 [Candidatus Micrarchaeia archaeon]|jgi:hypothetical protein